MMYYCKATVGGRPCLVISPVKFSGEAKADKILVLNIGDKAIRIAIVADGKPVKFTVSDSC